MGKWEQPKIKHLVLTKWNWLVSYPENLIMGENIDIGAFTYINASYGVEIQDDVQIGSHVSIYSDNSEDNTHGCVVIRKNAKIGSHCVLFPNIEIGKNARVGAHSVVKVDVPDDVTYTDHVLVK